MIWKRKEKMNIHYKISNAIKIGWWAYKSTTTLSNFKMLSDLLGLILKVAEEEKHYMTQIAFIHPDTDEKHEIVSIWAGAGVGADPTKRITELIEENYLLKDKLSNYLDKI